MYIYIYIYVYMYTHVYIYIYIYIYNQESPSRMPAQVPGGLREEQASHGGGGNSREQYNITYHI